MKKIPIAVLASGRGSNAEAIFLAIEAGKLSAEVVCVVSDQPGAAVLDKAKARGLKTLVIPAQGLKRAEHDRKVLAALEPLAPRFLVLAGYMRLVGRELLEAFRSERGYTRVVNIHPSLLPAFPGLTAYEKAFRHGVKLAGVTVHLVEEEMDSGPICAQESFSIADYHSAEEVERRGLEVEHRVYSSALEWILPEKFEIQTRDPSAGGRVCVCPN